MIQWEYKIRPLEADPGTLKEREFLIEQGSDGWELFFVRPSYQSSFYYFKRPLKQQP